jgi:hypothetical protein
LLAKVPKHAQAEVEQASWQIFDDITADPGEQAVAWWSSPTRKSSDLHQRPVEGAAATDARARADRSARVGSRQSACSVTPGSVRARGPTPRYPTAMG